MLQFRTMANLESILQELRQERDRIEQAIAAIEGLTPGRGQTGRITSAAASNPKRKMSAAGRARIAAAQRARWARVKGAKVVPISAKGKRRISAAGRARIAAAARARWVKVRAGKKK